MGLNFRKSLSIGKLFRINFSKRGIGVSAGVKGARVSLNKDGLRETFSLPGTGLSWSERQSFKKRRKSGTAAVATAADTNTADGDMAGVRTGGAARKKNTQWKSLIWVALVAGFFMLYKSGALDPMISRISDLFTGKSESSMTASDKPGSKGKGETAAPGQSADAAALQAGNNNQAASAASAASEGARTETASTAQASNQANPAGSGSVAAAGNTGTGFVTCKDGTVTLKATTRYVASKGGEKFHKLDCSVVESIASANLVEYDSREAALAKKEPCTRCNP